MFESSALAATSIHFLPKDKGCPPENYCFDNKCCSNLMNRNDCAKQPTTTGPAGNYCSICLSTGDCFIGDALEVGVNIAESIVYVLGIATMIMFLYGGFLWLTSAGNPAKVKSGFDIMKNTVLGIIVILLAWVLVRFFQNLIGLDSIFQLKSVSDVTVIWSNYFLI